MMGTKRLHIEGYLFRSCILVRPFLSLLLALFVRLIFQLEGQLFLELIIAALGLGPVLVRRLTQRFVFGVIPVWIGLFTEFQVSVSSNRDFKSGSCAKLVG